jgi:catechol 2,3-dioxygenase-like lactoylglutathione lyase family enzyme
VSAARAVPVLPVRDLDRSLAWYERLGFAVRARYPAYAIVAFEDAELHLVVFDVDYPPESLSGAYLRVDDADAVFARWSVLGAPVVAPPEDQPYGVREWATEDPDGNLWRISAPLLAADAGAGPNELGALAESASVEGVAESPDRRQRIVDESAPTEAATESPDRGQRIVDESAPTDTATESVPTDGSPGTGLASWVGLVGSGQACAGCGLVAADLPARGLGAQVRDEVHALGRVLEAADDDAVRVRPAPDSWSALEYGVHVRDLLNVFAERIVRTLAEHEPELGWWDHEAAIADGMANESFVEAVVDDLGRNASKLSESLRMVTEEDWSRAATRRAGERFTVESMARFTLHEVVHHRVDAERALAAATG